MQKFGLATGIVGVLILAGIFLSSSGANPDAATRAINAGVSIGTGLGILGIFGVIITLVKRVI